MRRAYIYLVVICMCLALSGCVMATGPLFKEVSPAEYKGKAIVYFYRNVNFGSVSTFSLRVDDGIDMPLPNKGYYLLILDPGKHGFDVTYSNKTLAKESFILESDKSYYIRFWADVVRYEPNPFSVGAVYGKYILSDSREEALERLKECRLIEVPIK